MIVLGLDPGTRHFGWGVVERAGTRLVYLDHDTLHVDESLSLAERLVCIETGLNEVITRFRPATASVETIFFAKDAQAAAKLGHARGVALLVCARAGLEVAEYPPASVKKAIAGNGRAEKSQVASMVRVLLGLHAVPAGDGADALALALTHFQHTQLRMPAGSRTKATRPRGIETSFVEPSRLK